MKIIIANHGIHPLQVGGMERHTYNLASSLHESGVEVKVLVPDFSIASHHAFPFPITFLPWGRRPLWLWANYEFSKHVEAYARSHPPDIILSQGFNAWAALKQSNVPIIFHPHGLEMFGKHLSKIERIRLAPFRSLVRYHAKHSQRVISLGGKLTDVLRDEAKVPSEKIVEIPNAVFPEAFRGPSQTLRRPKSFLFVGRLAFNKGIDFLPGILSRVTSPELRWTIVGDGPEREKVLALAKKDARVTYVSQSDDQKLAELYRTHECLLFTSRFEGMPTVILEAMAAGMSIIATKIGAIEAMVDEGSAQLAEPTVESLTQAMLTFLALSEEQKNIQRCRLADRIDRTFAWPGVTERYLELFREVRSEWSKP